MVREEIFGLIRSIGEYAICSHNFFLFFTIVG